MARQTSALRHLPKTLKAVRDAQIEVFRIEVDYDGGFALITAKCVPTAAEDDLDRELAEFEKRNGQS
jgi:hypothetical protein